MTNRSCPAVWLPMIAFCVSMTFPCSAQETTSNQSGLTATGLSMIKLEPKFLQMTLSIEGSSSELAQAAEELDQRIEKAKKSLGKLGAIVGSVTVSPAKLKSSGGGDGERQKMQQMIAQYGGGNRGKEMLKGTQSVSVVQVVVARWELPNSDSANRLIDTQGLIKKIEAADIGSSKDSQPLSPAQEELAAEMDAMADQYSYNETPKVKPGTPSFSYIAVLSEEKHGKAIESAYSDAKATISLLAKSTGQTIGSVRPRSMETISGKVSSYGRYNPYGNANVSPSRNSQTGATEVVSTDPAETEVTVRVHAIAQLQDDQS